MGQSLVVVESVAKTRTINKILGKDYKVLASVGHVKDLPKRKFGVDIENGFQPRYIVIRGKEKILRELKQAAATCDRVFLATDPDREGEAIAWHIAEVLRKKNGRIHRVLFTEITERGVLEAMENPQQIDMKKVEAQKARRVMDRLVGYQVSPILWNTFYKGLSAGRVQSVALRLICEREEEIEAFVPEEYWSITAKLQGERTEPFLSKLIKIEDKKPHIPDKDSASRLIDELKKQEYIVRSIKKKEVTRNPAPPFTTSTLQQEAANRLGYSTKRTMMIAQQLYEGVELGPEGSVGLITYMRTDSTRIADVALEAVRDLILKVYGREFLPAKPRHFKVKAGAQDAHEAIRPTSMDRDPQSIKKYLTEEQFKLYELIWNRFLACQMEAAVFEQISVDIAAGVYMFRTTGSAVIFPGFLQVYQDYESEEKEEEQMAVPRDLREGERLTLLDLIPKQHFTKPPARYTESSLVKELDSLGIGRPSTYAVIISTIIDRQYVERNGRQLCPTRLGRTVNKILVENFPDIFNVKFTAQMEEELDKVESGEKVFLQVMEDFYLPFSQALKRVSAKQKQIRDSLQQLTGEKCPNCGSDLIIKWGRLGRYVACTNPDCKFTKSVPEDVPDVHETCEVCGREMVVKVGRYGRFLACSGYPECKNSKPLSIGVKCPREGCSGEVVEKRSRRGRVFYGCSRYPECDFASWYKPVAQECPACGCKYLEERYTQAKGEYLRCPQCKEEFELELAEV